MERYDDEQDVELSTHIKWNLYYSMIYIRFDNCVTDDSALLCGTNIRTHIHININKGIHIRTNVHNAEHNLMISDENEMMWKKTQSHFICQISGKISSTQFDLENLGIMVYLYL
jgi:hypothetical protein